ncbi:hypothetical protein KO528_11075 [Saccharophagus degradans]|uniref:Piwi domain-containing protein n=1 Tax=Saccharophagus degradans TaxID=86304 RepID=UPI001C09907F|nr:Piwi domain-containing protein [Saccharophagus degradans]MBU2985895.1 hypothetical protein [Saccharophagus degradans]
MSNNGVEPNFGHILISKNELNVYSTEYSQPLFDECMEDPGDTFYYRDRSSNKIFAWSRDGHSIDRPVGFVEVAITKNEYPEVFVKIIQRGLISFFFNSGNRIFRKSHSSVYSFPILKAKHHSISNLKVVPYFCFSVGYLELEGEINFYISCWREFKWRFDDEAAIRAERVDTKSWDRTNGEVVGSKRNVKLYISAIGRASELKKIEIDIFNKISEYRHVVNSFEKLNSSKEKIVLIDGLKIDRFEHFSIPNANYELLNIQKPTHYYYNDRTIGGLYDKAVATLKPYSYEHMSGRQYKVVAMIPANHAGTCDAFVQKIREKLKSIFHLENLEICTVKIDSGHGKYTDFVSSLSHKQYDLAFFFLSHADKSQPLLSSDYTKLKAKLLGKGIPSQNILIETARRSDQMSLNNTALNMYSKLGGTPWIVNKEKKSALELVVGIGSSLDENNDRTIGFASVFDYHGSYILGGCSPISDMNAYTDKLQQHITSIISEAIQLQGVLPSSTIRLIFHVFKDASKRYELKAILEAVENFSDYNIEYSLVHISYNHSFKLYKSEGKDIVPRGTFIQLSDYWALLSMGGKRSTPLLVKIDPRSTHSDVFDLTKQILFFSHLSQKSFKPANKPVTTKYSSELARITNDLMTVPYWDTDMLVHLKDRVWFI